MDMRLYIAFLIIILVSACVQQEIHAIKIPGHDTVYTFASDIRKALDVKINNPEYIRNLFYNTHEINIVFNGSSTTDNAYFKVIMIDFAAKVPLYLAYEGRFVDFNSYYFLNGTWYNKTDDEIQKPELKEPTLWLIGPNTGANETSVIIHDNIVYLQGTSYSNLRLANDRLVLAIMNINSIKDI